MYNNILRVIFVYYSSITFKDLDLSVLQTQQICYLYFSIGQNIYRKNNKYKLNISEIECFNYICSVKYDVFSFISNNIDNTFN